MQQLAALCQPGAGASTARSVELAPVRHARTWLLRRLQGEQWVGVARLLREGQVALSRAVPRGISWERPILQALAALQREDRVVKEGVRANRPAIWLRRPGESPPPSRQRRAERRQGRAGSEQEPPPRRRRVEGEA